VDSGGYRSSTFVVGSLTSSRAKYSVVGVWENSPTDFGGPNNPVLKLPETNSPHVKITIKQPFPKGK